MQHVAFYITGHGYGHAVRSCAVIDACSQRNPFVFFHIRSAAPSWLFKLSLNSNYIHYPVQNDVGTIQQSFDKVDIPATLQSLDSFFACENEWLENEIAFLQKNQIRLVIGDIPPLAFEAAHRAEIRSIAIGNFSWDWIYSAYLKTFPGFKRHIWKIQKYYRRADLLLKLPFHGDMPAFPRSVEIPLLCKKAKRKSADIRGSLNCSPGHKLVLVALRQADRARLNLNKLASMKNVSFVFSGEVESYSNFRTVAEDELPFAELINAVDFVVSKPGFGIVADCIAHNKPLLYTDRADFSECKVLMDGLQAYSNSVFISNDDFWAGNWQEALAYLHDMPWPDRTLAVNGDFIAAENIDEFLQRGMAQSSLRKVSAASPRSE
ncbi:MAG: hypothetical protein DWQ05_04415 [Calditrichaeota bacterium]|nr:MAG: hypothetical protein DWQ05_04415 [Calditrichota bacterium]